MQTSKISEVRWSWSRYASLRNLQNGTPSRPLYLSDNVQLSRPIQANAFPFVTQIEFEYQVSVSKFRVSPTLLLLCLFIFVLWINIRCVATSLLENFNSFMRIKLSLDY